MKRTLVALQTTLALSGVAGAAPLNIANTSAFSTIGTGVGTTGGGGIIIRLPPSCPSKVSVAWCSDPNSQKDSCWSTNDSACSTTLRNAYQGKYTDLTTGPTPAGDSPHGTYSVVMPDGFAANGGKQMSGARVSYNQSRLNFLDHDLSYSSVIGIKQLAKNFGLFDLWNMVAQTAPMHPEWETDGNAINASAHPCTEYVYKKYYDYSRFEDAASSCKSDWICVYNAAISSVTPGINFFPLKKKNGEAMTVQLRTTTAAVSQPKNLFWSHNPSEFSDVFAYRNRYDVSSGIALASAKATPYSITDRWSWHTQMHDQQVKENLTLPEYDDMDARQKAIRDLYDAFERDKAALMAAGGGKNVYDILHPHVLTTTSCADPPMINPITGDPEPCKHPITTHTLPSYPSDSLAGFIQAEVNQITDLLIAEWDHKSYADGTTVDHGCLDGDSNRCDWTPKQFGQEYTGRFRAEREKDFQTCFDSTGEVFSTANFPPMNPKDHDDTDHLEAWMASAGDIRGKYLKDLPWTKDSGGQDVVGRSISGGKSLGDPSFFAVNYNYSAGYDAGYTRGGTDGQTICGVSGHVGGGLYADVQVAIIGTVPVLDAALHARAGQGGDPNAYADGHLIVLGKNIYSSGGELNAASGFNLSPADPSKMQANIGYDMIIPIAGIIPVHLHAGLDFSTGLNWGVSGNAPQGCDGAGNGARMTLTGTITPWANVGADLSAAIGITLFGLGAEAGVRGDLSLLNAKAPVNVTLTVGDAYIPDFGNYLSLTLNTNASIDLSALSGSISAYAEICFVLCESVEQEIYRWSGVNLGHVGLFDLTKSFPLILLKTAKRSS
jgi:hypothetical protein